MSRVRYIAIEGPIGVGKTTLARRLAASLGADLILESPEENPFLGPFYDDPAGNALAAQLYFLLQRARQLEGLRQHDLFCPRRISDFMFEKDPLFARLTLSGPELALYDDVYQPLAWQAPVPDKLLYLYAPVELMMARVRQRARPQEHSLEVNYLARVAERYADWFRHYRAAPLVTIDAAAMDSVSSEADIQRVLDALGDPATRIDLS